MPVELCVPVGQNNSKYYKLMCQDWSFKYFSLINRINVNKSMA